MNGSHLFSQVAFKILSDQDEVLGSYQINDGDNFFTPKERGILKYRLNSGYKLHIEQSLTTIQHFPESGVIIWTPLDRQSKTVSGFLFKKKGIDGNDSTEVNVEFLLPVRSNRTPSKVAGLELVDYKKHGESLNKDLKNYFNDADNDPLIFEWISSNTCVSKIQGSLLVIEKDQNLETECITTFAVKDQESQEPTIYTFKVQKKPQNPTKPTFNKFPEYTYSEGSKVDIATPIANPEDAPPLTFDMTEQYGLKFDQATGHITGTLSFDSASEETEEKDCASTTERRIQFSAKNGIEIVQETFNISVKPSASMEQIEQYRKYWARFDTLKEHAHASMLTSLTIIHQDLAKNAKQNDVKNLVSGLMRIAATAYTVTNPGSAAFIGPALDGVDNLQLNKERKKILRSNLTLLDSAHSVVQPIITTFYSEFPTFMEARKSKPCLFARFREMEAELNELEKAVKALEHANARIQPLFKK